MVAGRPGWALVGDLVATYAPPGAGWSGRVCRIAQARYAGRRWYAVVLVDGLARYATYEYNAELAVNIVERTRLLDLERAG